MAHQHLEIQPRQPLRQPFHQKHRPVPSAGAADVDGEIAFVLLLIARDQIVEQRLQAVQKYQGFAVLLQKPDDGLVEPAQGAQGRVIVGVGQKTAIQHHVGVGADAKLEAEGTDEHHQIRLRGVLKQQVQTLLELWNRHRRGVDDQVRHGPHRLHLRHLQVNGLAYGPVPGHGMTAAGLPVAADQQIDPRLQKEQLHPADQPFQPPVAGLKGFQAALTANVDADGHPAEGRPLLSEMLDVAGDELQGQIVHPVVSQVFEKFQGAGLARPGEPRNQHQMIDAAIRGGFRGVRSHDSSPDCRMLNSVVRSSAAISRSRRVGVRNSREMVANAFRCGVVARTGDSRAMTRWTG